MTKPAAIRFDVRPRSDDDEILVVVPVVNGSLLTDLIHEYERSRGYGPEEAYGGLIPSFFRWGPLDLHFLGHSVERSDPDRVPLLGCECGEWGCWPLFARVLATELAVEWSGFEQPFRPERDYSAFGPFLFDRAAYDRALVDLIAATTSRGP